MSTTHYDIKTQQEVIVYLSGAAMQYVISRLVHPALFTHPDDVRCEIDNLVNTLHNLLERSEPEPEPEPGNLDLIGG